MIRTLIALATTLVVVAAMAATLVFFFRRLRRIQEDRWGKENVKPFHITISVRRRQAAAPAAGSPAAKP